MGSVGSGTAHIHCHCNLDISQSVYVFLILPFNFFTFSVAIDSMVFDIDNFASGNNTLDNAINFLYVSCVKETFLYLVISVILYLSFIYNDNIGD